ncbi:MAG: hypothetical protein IKQ61_10475 [Spirochaetales bacterium]|nr:hypothetical protein [Spirochaetales bacterium]
MKLSKLLKAVGAAAIIGACLLPTACEVTVTKQGDTTINNGDGNGDTTSTTLYTSADEANAKLKDDGTGKIVSERSGIDFTDYATGTYSIKVSNNTFQPLVAFIGLPREESLISGVPAMRTNFGLKKNTELFAHSSDFVLFFVTESDYLANKNNLQALDNKPFTRIYAYYNANAENKVVYPISAFMGGTCSITLNNANCPYNVELRRDGINGETIGYAIHDSVNTVFKVEPGDYYVFPVYRKFDSNINEIVTVYPKKANGRAQVEFFTLGSTVNNYVLNSMNWIQDVVFSPSAAYIEIVNNSTNGIEFSYGAKTAPAETPLGTTGIIPGEKRIFVVKMECLSSSATEDPEFAAFTEYSQFNVGRADIGRVYITNNTTSNAGTNFKYYAGKKYTVTVTDNLDTSSLQEIIVDLSWKDNPVDVSNNLTDSSSTYKTSL